MPSDAIVSRIRGEYREMPGLSLTIAQDCRLWQMDAQECESVLQTLVAEGFLGCPQNGSFIAAPIRTEH